MNENTRVGLSIVVWCAILLVVVIGVVYVFGSVTPTIERPCEVTAVDVEVADELTLERVTPEQVGLSAEHLAHIDTVVEEQIAAGVIPGAVVGVIRGGKVAMLRAYGCREVAECRVAMDVDTRFDLASLTKPIATATAVMQLVECGKMRLGDRVDRYIDGFLGYTDKESSRDTTHIRIVDLLTHTSGLPPYISTARLKREYKSVVLPNVDTVIDYIAHAERQIKPRTECRYSCLNYVALAHIVSAVSGKPFDEYVEEMIFEPLHMSNSCFNPDDEYSTQCAPTTYDADGRLLRGVVHDPLARECMGGVSGNAGMFSTFDDLAIFVSMLLNGGEWHGVRVLSRRSVEAMLTPPRGFEQWGRTLGWSCCRGYSGVGGDLLTDSAVGHTGATGTSLVIDPSLDVAIIVLTNYRHTQEQVSVMDLRSKIATMVAASIIE